MAPMAPRSLGLLSPVKLSSRFHKQLQTQLFEVAGVLYSDSLRRDGHALRFMGLLQLQPFNNRVLINWKPMAAEEI